MKLFLLFLICFSVNLFADIEPVVLPTEVTVEMSLTPDDSLIKDKVWNRWTTKNFVVCSLSNQQAQYLHENLEQIKSWLYQRWSLHDVDFNAECKLICVDDENLFKKLFRLEGSSVEVRRDSNGKIKEMVIFLLLNGPPSKTVPMALSEVCISEFEQKYGKRFGWWAHRGMSVLNSTPDNILGSIQQQQSALLSKEPTFFSKTLLETTEEEYKKFDPDKKKMYDRVAAIFCLMIKKEFGTVKFQEMLKQADSTGNKENAVREVLGFKSYDDFDITFKRYMKDIVDDAVSGKIPVNYVLVESN
jgi:hypothetical protein